MKKNESINTLVTREQLHFCQSSAYKIVYVTKSAAILYAIKLVHRLTENFNFIKRAFLSFLLFKAISHQVNKKCIFQIIHNIEQTFMQAWGNQVVPAVVYVWNSITDDILTHIEGKEDRHVSSTEPRFNLRSETKMH